MHDLIYSVGLDYDGIEWFTLWDDSSQKVPTLGGK